MNIAVIIYTLGRVITIESAFMVLPGLVGLYYHENVWWTYIVIALLGMLAGILVSVKSPKTCSFSQKKVLRASDWHGF